MLNNKRSFIAILVVTFFSVLMITQSVYCEYPKQYTEPERQNFSAKADLIFEGTISDVRQVGAGSINAIDGDITKYGSINDAMAIQGLDLRWVVTFKVDKIIKGEFPEKTFKILVHSPTESFGFLIDDIPIEQIDAIQGRYPGKGYGKKCRIYVHPTSIGDMIIGKEELSGK